MDTDNLIPPKKDFSNNLHEYINDVAKTLSGGFANPLIDIILPSLHQKQFELWCQNIYLSIVELKKSKISLNDLMNNLEFISLLKETIFIASKNHQAEKLLILKNSIIKSIQVEIIFDKKIIFTRLIDSLTLQHLFIFQSIKLNLNEFFSISSYTDIYSLITSRSSLINANKNDLIYIIKELDKFGLLKVSHDIIEDELVRQSNLFGDGYNNPDLPLINITEIGNEFYDYVFENTEY